MKNLINKKFFVTGGAGFIGSAFVIKVINNFSSKVLNYDKISTQSSPAFVNKLKNHQLVKGNLNNQQLLHSALKKFLPDFVVHFAAESHVDRSITSPKDFVKSNVLGTFNLLETIRTLVNKGILKKDIRILNISTDEVYGSLTLKDLPFKETDVFNPSSVYSASKASADMLVNSYVKTYGLNCQTTNCSNNYGPRQFPEKLIPSTLYKLLVGKPASLYGNGENVRDWIYVEDHIMCLLSILNSDFIPGNFNVGSSTEKTNKEVVKAIQKSLVKKGSISKKDNSIIYIEDRLGHDFRYAINSKQVGDLFKWKPAFKFEEALDLTIEWYIDNFKWLKKSLELVNKKRN